MSEQSLSSQMYRRRTALSLAGTAIAAGLAGCSSLGGKSEFQQQLSTVEEATAKYQDPKKAVQDGFKIGGPYVPGMGWHFSHPKRLKQAAKEGFSLEKPPMLTYLETDEGLTLGSVEFGAPTSQVSDPDVFADESADATEKWHTHKAATHVFAVPDGKQTNPKNVTFEQWTTNENWAEFRPPSQDLSAGDTVSLNWGSAHGKQGERSERLVDLVSNHPGLKTLHVWVHEENPDGVFAPVNGKFTDGSHSH